MSSPSPSSLEAAIRDAGEGWIIDWFDPPSDAINHLRRTLEEINRLGRQRLGSGSPSLSEATLVSEHGRNPQRIKGFFQALGGTRTPEMLLMAWRIIQGMEIRDVQLSYSRRNSFLLRVVLESPSGEQDPPYESTNIQDFALFRHIGILEIDHRPVFDGFYPLRVREKVT